MATPKPGRPVRGSRTGRPIMAALDLLGRRWTLRILWELRDEALGFRELQRRCGGVSPSVLSQRLGELTDNGIVTVRKDAAYELSAAGRELYTAFAPLQAWAVRWAAQRRKSTSP